MSAKIHSEAFTNHHGTTLTQIQYELPPPAYWQDFERLTLDMCRLRWEDDYAERNGRQGQAQAGVDVSGYNHSASESTGVQCKQRTSRFRAGHPIPANTLTIGEIDAEIQAAAGFTPTLDRFIVATTGPRDTDLQTHVRTINRNQLPFAVALWFWDDYVEFLNDNPNLMHKYYQQVLEYRNQYDQDEHYYRLLAMAFDRPAIRTPFHLENRVSDFIDALSDVQLAISLGRLKERDGTIVDEVRLPARQLKSVLDASALLQQAREEATQGLADGRIVQHDVVLEIFDPQLADNINRLRGDAVAQINSALQRRGIQPLAFKS